MRRELESAIADWVLGRTSSPEGPGALQIWLQQHAVPEADARAILEQGLERLLVYRTLVQDRLSSVLQRHLPRTVARLGPYFEEYFARFLGESGARSRYLRDVTSEFLQFCTPLWQSDVRLVPYLSDLAKHEALHVELAALPVPERTSALGALDLEAGLTFDETARLVRYAYAVHEMPGEPASFAEPAKRDTLLLAYRALDHRVRWLELSQMAKNVLEPLMNGRSLRESLTLAAAEHDTGLDTPLLEGSARLLADLFERGVLLGPSPATPASE